MYNEQEEKGKGEIPLQRGKFIVFEGIDGAGKSTQISMLCDFLTANGRTVHTTTEPTEGKTGHLLREALSGQTPRTGAEMAALFVLDRIEHNKEIDALLSAGTDVICDRYYYSSLAYQGSICDYEWVRHMNCECPDIRMPDICIFLDLAPSDALSRIQKRGMATEIYEKEETLTRVRNTFLRVFDTLPDPVAIIDASRTANEVGADVLNVTKPIFDFI